MGNFSHMLACRSTLKNIWKNKLNTYFEQNFTTCSYGVQIGHAHIGGSSKDDLVILNEKLGGGFKEIKKGSKKMAMLCINTFILFYYLFYQMKLIVSKY